MRYLWLVLVCTGSITVCLGQEPTQRAATNNSNGQELAARVEKIFQAKCTECHGSQLARPKKRFGYVDDLKRVAANPKLVVPSKPDESKIWKLVDADEMPPEEAKAGPLTKEDKDAIRDWIAAGAPAAPANAQVTAAPANDNSSTGSSGLPFWKHLLFWAGRFHVVIIHFPIALVIAAAAGELWFWWLGSKELHPAVRFCIDLAALAAIPAAALGWLLAWSGAGAGAAKFALPGGIDVDCLFLHRWLGTFAAVVLVAIAVASEADARRGTRSAIARLLLFAGALVVGLTGHLGGILVHGEDYFSW